MKKDKKSNNNKRAGSSRMQNTRKRSQKGFQTNEAAFKETAIGVIEGNAGGFAFLIREDSAKDVYISQDSLNGAIHGDRVKAKIRQKSNGGAEGIVVEIISEHSRLLLGTFIADSKGSFFIADEQRISKRIKINENQKKDAKSGDKVLVKVLRSKNDIFGNIEKVFKQTDNIDWEIYSVKIAHNLPDEFDEKVILETERISETIAEEEYASRVDFRDSLVVTIDGDDSRDFDDAVSVTMIDGNYLLSVHIADVSHYVTKGSSLDNEAYKRGTSVYFPNSFIPMLPEKISCNICSLNEGQDRLCLSVLMEFTKTAKLVKHRICTSVIKSLHRLTYDKVQKVLENDQELCKEYNDVVPMLNLMKELATSLNKKRQKRGSVDFDLPESKISISESGEVINVEKAQRYTSHRIIEEFMLIANETVAKHMQKIDAPFVYRVHLPPTPLKLEAFEDFLSAMNITWEKSEPVQPIDYSNLLSGLNNTTSGIVGSVALRSMTKAVYFSENKGHFGLASEFYCHFTSPIRRYPDLLIHRIIKDYLKNGKNYFSSYSDFVSEAASHSSFTERKADEAERAVDDIYKARFMATKIGEEFSGVISGVTEWGVYVQLENTIEGLIRKENLNSGELFYNPVLMTLSNMTSIYRLGDAINIVVSAVSNNKIDFLPSK